MYYVLVVLFLDCQVSPTTTDIWALYLKENVKSAVLIHLHEPITHFKWSSYHERATSCVTRKLTASLLLCKSRFKLLSAACFFFFFKHIPASDSTVSSQHLPLRTSARASQRNGSLSAGYQLCLVGYATDLTVHFWHLASHGAIKLSWQDTIHPLR